MSLSAMLIKPGSHMSENPRGSAFRLFSDDSRYFRSQQLYPRLPPHGHLISRPEAVTLLQVVAKIRSDRVVF